MRHIIRSVGLTGEGAAYFGRTFAAGWFAGMLVPPGQTPIVFVLWMIFDRGLHLRFSLVAACILTLISNPLTTPFWYYIYYLTGQEMLGESTMEFAAFVEGIKPLLSDLSRDGVLESLSMLMKGLGYPVLVGSLVWHALMVFVGYGTGVLVYRALLRRRKKKKLTARGKSGTL